MAAVQRDLFRPAQQPSPVVFAQGAKRAFGASPAGAIVTARPARLGERARAQIGGRIDGFRRTVDHVPSLSPNRSAKSDRQTGTAISACEAMHIIPARRNPHPRRFCYCDGGRPARMIPGRHGLHGERREMTRCVRAGAGIAALVASLLGIAGAAAAQPPTVLTIFAAGTLAGPFRALDAVFEKKYPNVVVQPQFAGSVAMAKRITELHQRADLLAVADYRVIPKYLFGGAGKPAYADWYAGFARNAITFTYTAGSKFAAAITPRNWYEVLARPGVAIGRSNPDTDPSGYQTLMMLQLAERYYHVPGLAKKILANAPPTNMRDTEVSLISALQLGEIDYLAIYHSDAVQHHLQSLALPAAIDLSDPKLARLYRSAVVHTENGDVAGAPIVYAVTIPNNAPQAPWARKYVALLLGPQGQRILQQSGFGSLAPAVAVGRAAMPASLRPLVTAWPSP
jgi:molybdate/tungstate transport system substrate-binding protein